MTTPNNQPPTPPAVTDEMVEAAIDGLCSAMRKAHSGIALGAAKDRLRALIARARTPETATPVPGRLHAAAQAVLESQKRVRYAGMEFFYYEVDGSTMDELRAALAAAPTPAATDAGLREAVNAFTPCADCCDTPQWYDVVAAANPKSPPAPAPKPGPDLDALLRDCLHALESQNGRTDMVAIAALRLAGIELLKTELARRQAIDSLDDRVRRLEAKP